MAAAKEPEDAQSDRGTNSDNSTNEYTYGTSDGSDEGRRLLVGSEGREPMRFINPVRLMRYLERKKSAGRTPTRRTRSAIESIFNATFSVSPNNFIFVDRFYAWIYFTVTLWLENYLMVRGVRVDSGHTVLLKDTADPSMWLWRVYTRYLPIAMLVDSIILFCFFKVDDKGRAISNLADMGLLLRHIVKTIMREPRVTMRITQYPYPGHVFESQQVVTLLLVPVLAPTLIINAFRDWSLAGACVFNFVMYPMFFLNVQHAHPAFLVGREVLPTSSGWMIAGIAPLVLRAMIILNERAMAILVKSKKNGIDSVIIRSGPFFRIWRRATYALAPMTSSERMAMWNRKRCDSSKTQGAVSHEDLVAIAQAMNVTFDDLSEMLDGIRITVQPEQKGNRNRRAVESFIRAFAQTYDDQIEQNRYASIDINVTRQELWLRGIPIRADIDSIVERLQSAAQACADFSDLSISTVTFASVKCKITYSRVSGPLHFMHTATTSVKNPCALVGSTVVAIALGSGHVVGFMGKTGGSLISARVGSGSSLPAMGGRAVRWIGKSVGTSYPKQSSGNERDFVSRRADKRPMGEHDDDELHSDDMESYELTVLSLYAPWHLADQGHFEFQLAADDGSLSGAYAMMVTSNEAVIEEMNAAFAYKYLSVSERKFLLVVAHTLADEYDERVERQVANIARTRNLPHLACALEHRRDTHEKSISS